MRISRNISPCPPLLYHPLAPPFILISQRRPEFQPQNVIRRGDYLVQRLSPPFYRTPTPRRATSSHLRRRYPRKEAIFVKPPFIHPLFLTFPPPLYLRTALFSVRWDFKNICTPHQQPIQSRYFITAFKKKNAK